MKYVTEFYKPGTYCKDKKCVRLSDKNKSVKCADACGAYDFHKWLKKNGFEIVRIKEASIERLDQGGAK